MIATKYGYMTKMESKAICRIDREIAKKKKNEQKKKPAEKKQRA